MKRFFGSHDWHAKGRVNAIGAILKNTFLTLSLFVGSVNSDVFHAWMTQDLLPKMPSHAVIVMDNATFHKRSLIRQRILSLVGTTQRKQVCPQKWLNAIIRSCIEKTPYPLMPL